MGKVELIVEETVVPGIEDFITQSTRPDDAGCRSFNLDDRIVVHVKVL
jgi:hypothetical protein